MDARDVTAVLLAAGLSRRFGADDKLMAPFAGRALVESAAASLSALPFGEKRAVIRFGSASLRKILEPHGFSIISNDQPEAGLSRSIQLGVDTCRSQAVLIALADMPLVPAEHFHRLCEALSEGSPVVASRGPHGPTVPAAFRASFFPELRGLKGDVGARSMLADARTIAIDPHLLADIDIPEQLVPVRPAPADDRDASQG